MDFFACSSSARERLTNFYKIHENSPDVEDQILLKKIEICDYRVLLIDNNQPDLIGDSSIPFDDHTVSSLYDAWGIIQSGDRQSLNTNIAAQQVIDQIGLGIPFCFQSKSNFLRKFLDNQYQEDFFLLLPETRSADLPTFELIVLSNIWQLERNYLPVHSSGVIYKNGVFIFTGPSGSGKSTVASISSEMGALLLDEDQILIHKGNKNSYTADGWGYNIVTCDTPIRAIFQLIKDSKDILIPINCSQVSRILLERYNDILGDLQDNDLLLKAYRLSSAIARVIPGYELHFRKNPDFWKLIDKQFPD